MHNIGKYCIIDPDSGKLRPDNEVILDSMLIIDGDSKGVLGFVSEQTAIVESFAKRAACYPDIGKFLKCLSSTFYKLSSDDSSLRGSVLLESSRIKTLVADVSRFSRACGEKYKKLSKDMNVASKTKIDKLRLDYIGRIANTMPIIIEIIVTVGLMIV